LESEGGVKRRNLSGTAGVYLVSRVFLGAFFIFKKKGSIKMSNPNSVNNQLMDV